MFFFKDYVIIFKLYCPFQYVYFDWMIISYTCTAIKYLFADFFFYSQILTPYIISQMAVITMSTGPLAQDQSNFV